MSRLEPERIDISPQKPALAAAAIVIAAIREAGMDPRKAYDHPLCRDLVLSWRNGEMTRAQFIHCCRNMIILNPTLKPGEVEQRPGGHG